MLSDNTENSKKVLVEWKPQTKLSDWKRLKKVVNPNGTTSRVFINKISAELATVIWDSQIGYQLIRGNFTAKTTYDIEHKLKRKASAIKHCGDYGELFWNPDTQCVWWVAGDADGGDEYTTFEEITRLLSIKGVKRVDIECEAHPNDPGYVSLGKCGKEV